MTRYFKSGSFLLVCRVWIQGFVAVFGYGGIWIREGTVARVVEGSEWAQKG